MLLISKVFLEFVTLLLLFYVLGFWPQDLWDLSSPTGNQTCTPWIGKRSLNHWTTREVLVLYFSGKTSIGETFWKPLIIHANPLLLTLTIPEAASHLVTEVKADKESLKLLLREFVVFLFLFLFFWCMEEFLTWVLVILDLTFGIICNVLTADDEMTYLQMDNIYSDCLGPLLVIRYFEDLLIYSPEKDSLDAILCEDIRFNKLSLSPKICESLQQLKCLVSLEGKCNSRQSVGKLKLLVSPQMPSFHS